MEVLVRERGSHDLLAALVRTHHALHLVENVVSGLLVDESEATVALDDALEVGKRDVGAVGVVDGEVGLDLLLGEDGVEGWGTELVVPEELLVADSLIGVPVTLLTNGLTDEGKRDAALAAQLEHVFIDGLGEAVRRLLLVTRLTRERRTEERRHRDRYVPERGVDLTGCLFTLVVLVVCQVGAEHKQETQASTGDGVDPRIEGDRALGFVHDVIPAQCDLRGLCKETHDTCADDLGKTFLEHGVLVDPDLGEERPVATWPCVQSHEHRLFDSGLAANVLLRGVLRDRVLRDGHAGSSGSKLVKSSSDRGNLLLLLGQRLTVDDDVFAVDTPEETSQVVVGFLPVEGMLNRLSDLLNSVESEGQDRGREEIDPLERDGEDEGRREYEEEEHEVDHMEVLERHRGDHNLLASLQSLEDNLALVVDIESTTIGDILHPTVVLNNTLDQSDGDVRAVVKAHLFELFHLSLGKQCADRRLTVQILLEKLVVSDDASSGVTNTLLTKRMTHEAHEEGRQAENLNPVLRQADDLQREVLVVRVVSRLAFAGSTEEDGNSDVKITQPVVEDTGGNLRFVEPVVSQVGSEHKEETKDGSDRAVGVLREGDVTVRSGVGIVSTDGNLHQLGDEPNAESDEDLGQDQRNDGVANLEDFSDESIPIRVDLSWWLVGGDEFQLDEGCALGGDTLAAFLGSLGPGLLRISSTSSGS
mmetsp:Transcript_11357/g.13424  ORF Transcript_11357/g.13424 Transcript_11357/m.13424 type:complete len:703 (-) Transcript_11357:4077-6185(-)